MQHRFSIPVYKIAPFIRLLAALIGGILIQWYFAIPLIFLIAGALFLAMLLFFLSLLPLRFLKQKIQGVGILFLFFLLGCLLVYQHDIRNRKNYFKKFIHVRHYQTVVCLAEPLTQKIKSYKALAKVLQIINKDTTYLVTGNIILYFKKDSAAPDLNYGATILINKTLDPIKNSGNPGAFNYEQQSLFKEITHQVFLNKNDYTVLPEKYPVPFISFLYTLRNKVLAILDRHILPLKEKGVAEALLIGYRDDLDKELVQAFSNTGTIHVIAISGLHLGFIYLLLVAMFKPFEKTKWINTFLRPIVIIAVLWIFSLLAGGAASILRSAIMFTCIVLGDCIGRKSSIFNTLAFSAFIILCIQPFSLWDVGFQLSYAAVTSIVIFMQPIYRWFAAPYKWLDWLWKLNAVTLAAQILTLPLVIYHFHQFPNLFLITNIVAVPLSTLILAGELLLVSLFWLPGISNMLGTILTFTIRRLNRYIERCNSLSFAVTDYLYINTLQAILLFAIISATAFWLFKKNKQAFLYALCFLIFFLFVQIKENWHTIKQRKLVVYNIPKMQAIDFIEGSTYRFIGDTVLEQPSLQKNFYLKPARIALGINTNSKKLVYANLPLVHFANKNILVLDDNYLFQKTNTFRNVDIAIVSKNPKLYIDSLVHYFSVKQIVADASNPVWKIRLWEKDCKKLGIPFYNTSEKGAFILDL